MKVKYLIAIAAAAMLTVSCKDDKKSTDASETQEVAAPVDQDMVVITLNATAKKDDSFQIYYKQDLDVEAPFKEEESVYAEFKGADQPQDIVWKLPKNVLPTMLRFDLGVNKEQTPILINRFTVSLNGKKFEYSGTDFSKIFMANDKTVKFDAATATATAIPLENGGYDPLFNSTILLNDELSKIVQ